MCTTPIEDARRLQVMVETDGLSVAAIARNEGISESTVRNKLKLLSLHEEVQEMVAGGDICPTLAYEIALIPNPAEQLHVAPSFTASGKACLRRRVG